MKKCIQCVLFFAIILWITPSLGQNLDYTGNPDRSFLTARELAFNGKRDQARDTLNQILVKYPDYVDVRGLLASTLSWDGRYEEARKQFNRITSRERHNKEVWIAAIKNEMYGEEYYLALGLANKALLNLTNDRDLLELRGLALKNIHGKGNKPRFKNVVDSVNVLNHGDTEIKSYKNKIGIESSFEIFDAFYDPMFYTSLEYSRETGIGLVLPRINYSNRFNTNGLQYEIDFYPKFSKSFYGYLNYGYSNATTYPNHRAGIELFANLTKSLEVSLGMRYLEFDAGNATIFTGSISLYKGNYYFSLRPYVTPKTQGNLSLAGDLIARKYFKDGENYVGIRGGMGYSPELRQLKDGDMILAETVLFLESERLRFEYQFTGQSNLNLYRVNIGVNRQELVFATGNFFWAFSAGISYQMKF